MVTRRALQGLVNSFLGTYVSRYSDHQGYCVFGLLIDDCDQFDVDLLSAQPSESIRSPKDAASHLARARFWDQADKHGLARSVIRGATLTISRAGDRREGEARGLSRPGYDASFEVRATSDHGRTYVSVRSVFVAIHDPDVELRRHPENWSS